MFNHFKNQRNLSRKLLLIQLCIAVVVGLICTIMNRQVQGVAFTFATLIIAIAHFVTANLVFTNRVQAASIWFGRLLLAVVLKWLIVISLMFLFIQQLKEAPLMAILGVIASLVTIQVFNYLDARVNRGS
jgi:F0F1-type ATP synthase assembly protein I